ncbi:hypothetical protein YYG_01633 [Plasmodium vinckei petteri]|uniref:Fam-c protein n=1 Tax=Plasmodium vinckei petteri TaxID=138298 RepID=W7AJF7_PLAVN|nr:hypothetical protein YYG_01633 [Plasmodium vinckei petteri]
MNKRIFSLVCIFFYVILAVAIHCSEQKESSARNKSVCDGAKDNLHNKEPSNLSHNEMVKAYMIINKYYWVDRYEFEEYIENIFKNDPKKLKRLNKLFHEILKDPTNYKPRAEFIKYYYKTNPMKKQNKISNEIKEETKSKNKQNKISNEIEEQTK